MMPSVVDEGLGDPHLDVKRSVEEADLSRSFAPAPQPPRGWHLATERGLLAMLIAGAAWVRLIGPGLLEPNVSVAEMSNLAATETLLANPGGGLLGWTGAGASGLALLPSVWLR